MFKFNEYSSLTKKISGGLLLTIGLIVSFILIRNIIRDFPIWFFGERVVGIVEESWYELVDENAGELTFTYYVRYNFDGPEGEEFTGSSRLGAQEWMGLSPGTEVIVMYSSLNPENNRIDDSRFMPMLLCSYVPFVIIAWFLVVNGWKILYRQFKKTEPDFWVLEEKKPAAEVQE